MTKKKLTRNLVLGILFFLPVIFLLFLYPSTHNYEPLDIINNNVSEISLSDNLKLKDHITVLAFFGKKPMNKVIAASNLKELVYDKFKGFKKFQIIAIVSQDSKPEAEKLKKEISAYEHLKYWHFSYHTDVEIRSIYNTLNKDSNLNISLASDEVFIIDKDLNQRGRIDDRTDSEKKKERPAYELPSYNCIEVSEIKNKMSDDMRILFTEYRQKRKGDFDSSSRRANDLNNNNEQN